MTRVYKQNVSGRVTLLPETNLWPVWPVMPVFFNETSRKKNEETFSRNIHMRSHIPDVLGPGFEKLVSIVNLCFLGVNYASATRQRILTKIRAYELQEKNLRAQASTLLIFASNSSKGQIFRALQLKLNRTILHS